MKADYIIELENGSKISLLFCTKAFTDLSEKIGVELEEMYDNIFNGKMYRAKDFPHLLLSAANAWEFYNDSGKEYTVKDAMMWMDEIGMLVTAPQVQEIYKVFAAKMVRVDPNSLATETVSQETDTKKKETGHGGGTTAKRRKVV